LIADSAFNLSFQIWLSGEEKKSLKENDVWEVANKNHILTEKPLHSKWIFRIKQDGKYKARLIKGCEQKKEIDYQETYSPIERSALRSIFAQLKVTKW